MQNRLETVGLVPDMRDRAFELANSPIDFVGMNLFSRGVVSAENDKPAWWVAAGNDPIPGGNYLTDGQELYPQALPAAVHLLREEYGVSLPLYVTENG